MIKLIDDAFRQQFNNLAKNQGLLPIKVTPHYQSLVEAEVTTLGRAGRSTV
jgi:hypothetical protein